MVIKCNIYSVYPSCSDFSQMIICNYCCDGFETIFLHAATAREPKFLNREQGSCLSCGTMLFHLDVFHKSGFSHQPVSALSRIWPDWCNMCHMSKVWAAWSGLNAARLPQYCGCRHKGKKERASTLRNRLSLSTRKLHIYWTGCQTGLNGMLPAELSHV